MNPEEMEEKQRTNLQNKALHKLFNLMAEALNDAGFDMKKTLKPGVDIPWSTLTIKEYIWKPIQKAQLNKKSTTELSTKDIDRVYDVIMRHFGEKFGINVEFPSVKRIMLKLYQEDIKKGKIKS